MDMQLFLSITASNVAVIGFFALLGILSIRRIESNVKSISNRIDTMVARFENIYLRLDAQTERIDQIYRIIFEIINRNSGNVNDVKL